MICWNLLALDPDDFQNGETWWNPKINPVNIRLFFSGQACWSDHCPRMGCRKTLLNPPLFEGRNEMVLYIFAQDPNHWKWDLTTSESGQAMLIKSPSLAVKNDGITQWDVFMVLLVHLWGFTSVHPMFYLEKKSSVLLVEWHPASPFHDR